MAQGAHPPAGSKIIRVTRFEVPIGHPVVEKYAGTASDHTRPPVAIDALDAGNAVATLVGGAEIRRLAGGLGDRLGRARTSEARVLHVYLRRQPGTVLCGE